MGNSSQLEWGIALLLLMPGMFVMTFPETWIALLGALLAGWFRLNFAAATGATVVTAGYVAVRVAITGSGQGWNIATPYGGAFIAGAALIVAVLFALGYCFGRLIRLLVDRRTYG